jgi:hypothetical protein
MSLIERLSLAELRVVCVTAGQCLELRVVCVKAGQCLELGWAASGPRNGRTVPGACQQALGPTCFFSDALRLRSYNIMSLTVPFKHCFTNWLLCHTAHCVRWAIHRAQCRPSSDYRQALSFPISVAVISRWLYTVINSGTTAGVWSDRCDSLLIIPDS